MNRARQDLMRRLARHGSWMDRAALVHGLGWSEGRVDDELADLVAAGDALWNERARQYRLAGAPMARQTARELLRRRDGGDTRRALLLARPDKAGSAIAVGVARLQGDALVMAELELPHPARGDLATLERVTHALLRLTEQTDAALAAAEAAAAAGA